MYRSRFRLASIAAGALLAVGSLAPVHAATVITTGTVTDNFNFLLDPGKYFRLDFGSAPINMPFLEASPDDAVVASFYVEVEPGVLGTSTGVDFVNLSCSISPGGNCSQTDFGPVALSLAETGGVITGSYTFGPAYYNCFGAGEVPAVDLECGRDFFLSPALFDVTIGDFSGPPVFYPYRLTISDNPIRDVIPEPATWALLLLGFGAVGAAIRRRRASLTFAEA